MTHISSARGFSLVELLIAVTLGLLLLAGIGSVFLGSKQSFRSQESLGQLQESGRFANYMVMPHIRNAGYVGDPIQLQSDPTTIFTQTPGGSAVWGVDKFSDSAPAPLNVSAVNDTDLLYVSYFGQDDPITGTDDTAISDCLGLESADGLGFDERAENIFFISETGDVRSLSCRAIITNLTSGAVTSDTQPLIADVIDLQILYGVDTDATDDDAGIPGQSSLHPDEFVTATDLTDWSRVVAVKLDITTAGQDNTEGAAPGAAITNQDGVEQTTAVDVENGKRRLRRVFSNTVLIRNRLRN